MHHVLSATALVLAALTTGCVGPDWQTEEEGEPAGAELVGEPPTLVFSADYEEWATKPLRTGHVVHVDYDLSRLGPCPTAPDAEPSWWIEARYRADDGEEKSLPVSTMVGGEALPIPSSFIVPEGRELAIFFVATDGAECAIFDAYYSVDYRFPID